MHGARFNVLIILWKFAGTGIVLIFDVRFRMTPGGKNAVARSPGQRRSEFRKDIFPPDGQTRNARACICNVYKYTRTDVSIRAEAP